MKRIYCLNIILIFLFIFAMGSNAVTAKTLYDDFSGDYLDTSKWNDRELVREVANGKLVSKVRTDSEKIRNFTRFQGTDSISAIQADITVVQTSLENGDGFARLESTFYNTQTEGGVTGDIWAELRITDTGSGLKATYEINEATSDDWSTWDVVSSGQISTGLNYNQEYTVKIEYDQGLNKLTFTVGTDSVEVDDNTLPTRQRDDVEPFRSLTTGIDNATSGINYVHALFDNILTNGTAYDNFSTAPLDQTKWQDLGFAREVENGKIRLISHSNGERETTRLHFAEISPYTEATVTIKSDSMLETEARGSTKIGGNIYNDTYGPGNYNGYEGNVWVNISIDYKDDGTLKAKCRGGKVLDANDEQEEELFYIEFSVPIILDRPYRLSIHFTGIQLRFSCQDTVTGREEINRYQIETSVFEPYHEGLQLTSRVYGNGSSGYMVVEFDDVYVDIAKPPATYDATGEWELIGSNPWTDLGCELPDVGGTTDLTIAQTGNDFTMVLHDDEGDLTFDGVVYGESFWFLSDVEIEGDREANYGVFHLSQALSGIGSFTSYFFSDGIYQCRRGFNIALTAPDADGDGISDFIESSGPNSGDANDDGTLDSLQDNVASLKAYNSQEHVVLETPAGTVLSSCQAADNPSPGDAPAKMNFDYGFFSFTISGIAPGGSTTLTMTLPDGVKVDTYQKYGKTPANPNINEWYEFLYDTNTDTGVEINNNVLTFHFVDALRGDDILVQDSKAIDIGGPGFAAGDGGGGGGGGGGCFIDTLRYQ
jgi:hypothetical protein